MGKPPLDRTSVATTGACVDAPGRIEKQPHGCDSAADEEKAAAVKSGRARAWTFSDYRLAPFDVFADPHTFNIMMTG